MRFSKISPESFLYYQKKNRSNYGTAFFYFMLFWVLGELELISYPYLNNSVILVVLGISILKPN